MTLTACAEIVRQGDPDRFLAAMAAPVAARARLLPLYAFNVEVSRAAWASPEPMIGEMRLQFWRDAVEEIGQGKPPRAHEVVAPLAEVIGQAGLPVAACDALIAARRWDLYRDPFDDDAAFDAHLQATGGGLMWLSARALGARPEEEAPARRLGQAAALASWLVAVPRLEALGRLPLVDGRAEAVRRLAAEGLAALEEARRARFSPAAVPALRAAWRARGVLTRAAATPQLVAQGGLEGSEFARRGGLLWRSLRGRW